MTATSISPLYLSRLILNPRSRQAMSELVHPYEMHRTLMRAFPALEDTAVNAREEYSVLFRAEEDNKYSGAKVYVQSLAKPDWSFLERLNGYLHPACGTPAISCKDIMPAYQKITDGQIFRFRLYANPTKRIAKKDDLMKGKRVGIRSEKDQVEWLVRKAAEREKGVPGGFEILTQQLPGTDGAMLTIPRVNVRGCGSKTGRKKQGDNRHSTAHYAVSFDGLLQVVDADAFRQTLIRGIGPAKAFGFGLLSVMPASEGLR